MKSRAIIKYFFFLLFCSFFYLFASFFSAFNRNTPRLSDSWIFKENQNSPVLGDLGGKKVSIPKQFANFVEYENDPHFLEPRNGPTPTRTHQSRLRSFGFEVRYPDMVDLTAETLPDKNQHTIYNTNWISVSIRVEPYYDRKVLERQRNAISDKSLGHGKGYKPSTRSIYGLVVHETYGFDEAKRKPFTHDALDKNIYLHIDETGQIDNFIKCSNVRHEAAPCNQSFLIDNFKNTMVEVDYRIGFLPHWQEIQSAVTNRIKSFAVQHKKLQFQTLRNSTNAQYNYNLGN